MSYSPTPDEPPAPAQGWWLMFVLPAVVVVTAAILRACN